MAQTPYLQLAKPNVGDPETSNRWGIDLNTNFDKLDNAVGPLPARIAALEAKPPVPGPPGPPGPAGPPGEGGDGEGGLTDEAPADGKIYGRRDETWAVNATISTSAPSGGVDGDVWYQVAVTAITLGPLALSTNTVLENAPIGTTIGTVLGQTIGSSLAMTDTASGRFSLSGVNVLTAVVLDYEGATSHIIGIQETLAGATNTPRLTSLTINVTDVAEGGADTTPNPFSFTDQVDVALASPITSNTITVSGIDAPAPLSITGGTYSINGGSFVSSATTIISGSTVAVRVTSSALNATPVNATLTIGGVSDTFTVTTVAASADTTPNPFTFTDQTGVALLTPITSNTITVTGIDAPASLTISGGQYSINGGAFAASATTVSNGNTVAVRVTSSGAALTPVSATLTIGGVSDTFTVTTMAVAPGPFTLTWASAASELTNLAFGITPAPLIGDSVVLTLDNNSDMSSPFATSAANVVDAGEAGTGSLTFTGITTPLAAGLTYARVNVTRSGLNTDSSIASITLTAAAPAWSPLDLGAKLMVFYDPNVPSSITGNISQLDDLSTNADHLTQTFAGLRPTLDTNGFGVGLKGILFDGTDDSLTTGDAAVTHPGTSKLTIAGVAKMNPATSYVSASIAGYRGTGVEYYGAGSAQVYRSAANTFTLYSNGTGPSATMADNTRFRYIATCNGTTGILRFNGAVTTNSALGGTAFAATGAVIMGGSLGSSGVPTQYWGGHVGPLIICNDVLTTGEETSLDAWLAAWNT